MGDSSSSAEQQSQRPRNVVLGKYEMGRLLGKGSFAKVYYGKHIVTQDCVAIKVISKDKLKKDQLLLMEQIKREISVMRLLRHPNIVQLREVMATKGKIFFIMEYVKGGELFAKLVKNGKFKEDSARKYFQQLVTAVDFCHSRGVSHRDLKPENLLLDENGDLKVSDFGLSALLLPHQPLLHTQCGTPAYVAPEVLRKKGYDGAKADIWSCGVILFVLLAGYLPFQDDNLMNLYRKVFKADYKFPPWVSAEAKRLISKLLVVDPDKRIPISTIMHSWWFRKNPPITPLSSIINQDQEKEKEKEKEEEGSHHDYSWEVELLKSNSKPRFFNAFEFISSMSSGFDLSNLFEEEKSKYGSIFTSKCCATKIVGKLESIAKKLNFGVLSVKDYKVKLQGKSEGRKGKLVVIAEIFEVAPEVVVVELSKSAGDTLEYRKLCDDEIRPLLKDIVWSWQGDQNN